MTENKHNGGTEVQQNVTKFMERQLAQISGMYFSPSQQDKARLTSSHYYTSWCCHTVACVPWQRFDKAGRCWYIVGVLTKL